MDRKKILLVEDDPDLTILMEHILSRPEFSLHSCSNGKQALELISNESFHLIVTDMVMPEMDGIELIKELQKLNFQAPVLAISSMREYLGVAKDLGAREVLEKPFNLERFLNVVRKLVGKSYPLEEEAADVPSKLENPETEEKRIEAIKRLGIDRLPLGIHLDQYAKTVAQLFSVKTCMVSIITQTSQYWTAGHCLPDRGRETRGSPKSESFCVLSVKSHAPLIVSNAKENPIFKDNPFVDLGVRFYAGVPISDFLGHVVGTFCLLANRPKPFTGSDLRLLSVLARRVEAELDLLARNAYSHVPKIALRHNLYYDPELQIAGRNAFLDLIKSMNIWCSTHAKPLALFVLASGELSTAEISKALKKENKNLWQGHLGAGRLGLLSPGQETGELERDLRPLLQDKGLTAKHANLHKAPERWSFILERLENELNDLGLASL
ncbi:MAG: response regulator [Bacteriovoracaceae bacterium]